MKIGSVKLYNNTVLAPLAGISNLPFRLIAKTSGCGLVCSEMISANGLVHGSVKTKNMLATAPEERPVSIQIFGSDPAIMADAARIVQDHGADILDINLGCSVKKVVKTGAGAALMRTPDTAGAIFNAVRKAITIPLTIKIRTGWDKTGEQAMNIAHIAEGSGVDAIAVHPRTAAQLFRGEAEWSLIKQIKSALSIPVIGNGDIIKAEDALRMIEETRCDAVMIGRAAIGNPYIFTQITTCLSGDPLPELTLSRQFELMKQYLVASVEYIGEAQACRMMRSRLGWFVKGLRNSSKFREAIKQISTQKEGLSLLDTYEADLSGLEDEKGVSAG
ncbi:MAG: tRNA dihydrouridine synthase DusB [Desulfobacterales bacterium]|nr:tRNA dihydrouridine synthase DusB [Desulfobacterales bacterium]